MRLAEQIGPVYVLKPGTDYQAGIDGDSFKMNNHREALLLIQFGSLTGDAVLTVNSGATAGTKTTAESFRYRLASAVQGSASADLFGAWATSSSLTLTAATYENKLMEVEISADELTDGQHWVTPSFSAAADALNVAVVAVLSESRYAATTMPTAIA